MKTIGFISERGGEIIRQEYLDTSKNEDSTAISEEEREKLIQYLQGCDHVFSITLSTFDAGKYLGPYMIFSDGKWLAWSFSVLP